MFLYRLIQEIRFGCALFFLKELGLRERIKKETIKKLLKLSFFILTLKMAKSLLWMEKKGVFDPNKQKTKSSLEMVKNGANIHPSRQLIIIRQKQISV